jgi:predicted transcriptional regulator of viral defense system
MTKMRLYTDTHPTPCITDTELMIALGGTPDSRYGKVKRALAVGELIRLRRGLYLPGMPRRYAAHIHPFEIAQWMYGPSYISFQAALSFHGLIPEAVYTITSANIHRAKEFSNTFGLFSYRPLPRFNFFVGVELKTENENTFLIATPWKAILDYVYSYKLNWIGLEPLEKSLRIEIEDLPKIDFALIKEYIAYYQSKRITLFLKSLPKEITNV